MKAADSGRVRGGQERLACTSSVLVEHEHGEDIAEQHASRDERNTAENKQAGCTHGSEGRRQVG